LLDGSVQRRSAVALAQVDVGAVLEQHRRRVRDRVGRSLDPDAVLRQIWDQESDVACAPQTR